MTVRLALCCVVFASLAHAETRLDENEEAKALFLAAANAQLSGPKTAITSYSAKFSFKALDYPEGKSRPKSTDGEITQWWASVREGDKVSSSYRRKLTSDAVTSAADMTITHDNKSWGLDSKGRTVSYGGREYSEDRKRLKKERSRMVQLFDFFVLHNLKIAPGTLTLVAKERVYKYDIGVESHSPVVDELSFTHVDGRKIVLRIAREKHALVSAEVHDEKGVERYDMAFACAVPVGKGETKLQVPCHLAYYRDNRLALEVTTSRPEDIKLNAMDAAAKKKIFGIPESKSH